MLSLTPSLKRDHICRFDMTEERAKQLKKSSQNATQHHNTLLSHSLLPRWMEWINQMIVLRVCVFPPPLSSRYHGCQMTISRFLDCMCLPPWASGLWLRYATLQNLIPTFPWIAPPPSSLAQSKERK